MANFRDEKMLVILDLKTKEQRTMEIEYSHKCAVLARVSLHDRCTRMASICSRARAFVFKLFLIRICFQFASFHPRDPNILAIGSVLGSVRIWDIEAQTELSSFSVNNKSIEKMLFAFDGTVLIASHDISYVVTLDDQFDDKYWMKLKGHERRVMDIMSLSANICITGGRDYVIKVWNCRTGACLRTLPQHRSSVTLLALDRSGHVFASGSWNHLVIIWSSATFEILHRLNLTNEIQVLAFGEGDNLYAGVFH